MRCVGRLCFATNTWMSRKGFPTDLNLICWVFRYALSNNTNRMPKTSNLIEYKIFLYFCSQYQSIFQDFGFFLWYLFYYLWKGFNTRRVMSFASWYRLSSCWLVPRMVFFMSHHIPLWTGEGDRANEYDMVLFQLVSFCFCVFLFVLFFYYYNSVLLFQNKAIFVWPSH